ncbi:hypothetical protein KFK09_023289 [Dendrobium nobile]|uniref:Uncharacterized protein n=1 Tax=Dendrobium nobile TaxID=94219 RepID=A0A8T3AL36_DENNO|nr:hypothetical protein KFK09_023289 [Dendrobium nobile]
MDSVVNWLELDGKREADYELGEGFGVGRKLWTSDVEVRIGHLVSEDQASRKWRSGGRGGSQVRLWSEGDRWLKCLVAGYSLIGRRRGMGELSCQRRTKDFWLHLCL